MCASPSSRSRARSRLRWATPHRRRSRGPRPRSRWPAAALCGRQCLPNPLADGGELQLAAGDVLDELVRRRLLALGPELADEGAGVAAREPGVAEGLAQVRTQLGLERPRAQI